MPFCFISFPIDGAPLGDTFDMKHPGHVERNRALPFSALICGLCWVAAGLLSAQTFTTLYDFSATSGPFSPNGDGARPFAPLIICGNSLYGTARYGGPAGKGTVFALNTDGTGFTNLHGFTSADGAQPAAGLVLSSDTLYGAAQSGGASSGTLFALNTNSGALTALYLFTSIPTFPPYTNGDGAQPAATLVLAGNTLYGTAVAGGSAGSGAIFAIRTDGTGFTNLHNFVASADGAQPHAGLVLSGDTLYGATFNGGSAANGTIFSIKTNGMGFTNLHNFTALLGTFQTNSDGASPVSGLVLSGTNLFGVAQLGGRFGAGTVFRLSLDGASFETLYDFSGLVNNTNNDGAEPHSLILSGSTLYCVAGFGGQFGNGTVFGLKTDGTGFTTLHSFTGPYGHGSFVTNADGSLPAGLVLFNHTLYGTAQFGGSSGNGTVFSISLTASPPALAISSGAGSVILAWPTNSGIFTLQSATNLISPVWIQVSGTPGVVNGQNVITNSISKVQQFFRLSP